MILEKLTYEKMLEEPGYIFKYEPIDVLNPTISTFFWDNPVIKSKIEKDGKILFLLLDYNEVIKESEIKNQPSFIGTFESSDFVQIQAKLLEKEDLKKYIYDPNIFLRILSSIINNSEFKFEYSSFNFQLIPNEQINHEKVKEEIKQFYKQFYVFKKIYEKRKEL